MRPLPLLLFVLLPAFLIAACARAPPPVTVPNATHAGQSAETPVSVPDAANVSAVLDASPDALPATIAVTLLEGETRTVRILGNLYTLRLSASANGSATLTVNAQDFTLKRGEEFSFGDFVLRLDTLVPDAASGPRPSSADLILRVPDVGSVRDVLTEGAARRYAFPDGTARTLLLKSVGTDGKGDDAALVSLDGEQRFLTEGEDAPFADGNVFLFHLYRVPPGARVPLAEAKVTIIQNS